MIISQNEKILHYLKKRGNKITPMRALNMFGCFRLGARVYDLKKQGHNIACEFVKRRGKHFAEYQLIN